MRDVDCLAVPPFPRTPEPDSQICFNTVLAVARSHGARNIPAKGAFFAFAFSSLSRPRRVYALSFLNLDIGPA